MAVGYRRFVRSSLTPEQSADVERASELARRLRVHLDQESAQIDMLHIYGAQSSVIQGLVADVLRSRLEFQEEVVITPEDGLVTRARPDFFYSLGAGRGIIAEVERGGTVTNNHDLKDLWKTHISPDAQHLFLVVPNANWSFAGKARETPFARVQNRLSAFFGDPRREVDVLSCHIFGYGRLSLGPPGVSALS